MHRHSLNFDPIVTTCLDDLLTPGVMVELTPDDAEALGAFEETALSEADAWEANMDVAAAEDGGDG